MHFQYITTKPFISTYTADLSIHLSNFALSAYHLFPICTPKPFRPLNNSLALVSPMPRYSHTSLRVSSFFPWLILPKGAKFHLLRRQHPKFIQIFKQAVSLHSAILKNLYLMYAP